MDYEKLGAFYLGKDYDLSQGKPTDNLVLYDSKDLVTHGVVIGMTGSGKTGLGIALLEEALIDNIPFIAIDPKGDLTNILLTFDNLTAENFRPWINEAEASTQNLSPDDFAKQQAEFWEKGLGEWGQNVERIRKLRQSVDFAWQFGRLASQCASFLWCSKQSRHGRQRCPTRKNSNNSNESPRSPQY